MRTLEALRVQQIQTRSTLRVRTAGASPDDFGKPIDDASEFLLRRAGDPTAEPID
jgi:hypothetical protein